LINPYSTIASQVQRQDWKNIVMTRHAGLMFHKFIGGALKHRQRSSYRSPGAGRLSGTLCQQKQY
jgi:hypothetical protein